MANEMNINQLKTFLVQQVGSIKIDKNQAEKLGIDASKFESADIDTNEYLNLNEIIANADLYGDIAALYAEKTAQGVVPEEQEPAKEKEEDKEKVKPGDESKTK